MTRERHSEEALEAARKYGMEPLVLEWLSDAKNAEKADENESAFENVVKYAGRFGIAEQVLSHISRMEKMEHWWYYHFADCVFWMGKYGTSGIVLKWLSEPTNTELAARKHGEGFVKVVEYSGEFRVAKRVFNWLEDPTKAGYAAREWHDFSHVVRQSALHKSTDAVFNWLSDAKKAEKAAENWSGFCNIVIAAGEHRSTKQVLDWLSYRRNLELVGKEMSSFSSLVDKAGKYRITNKVFRFLSRPENAEEAAKDWNNLGYLTEDGGKYGIGGVVYDWLAMPGNARLASEEWSSFRWVVDHAGKRGIADIVFGWLGKPENAREAAKGWTMFSCVVDETGKCRTADIVFGWLSKPENAKLAASGKWHGIDHLVSTAGYHGTTEAVFAWLDAPQNARAAARNWGGFQSAVRQAGNHGITDAALAYLGVKKNLDAESADWYRFAGRLEKEEFRKVLMDLPYFSDIFASFEERSMALTDEEKKCLVGVVEMRKRRKKDVKKGIGFLLDAMPSIRRTVDGVGDNKSKRFVLKYSIYYTGASDYEPGRFREFVDSLEASKKRIKEMERLGVNTKFWNGFKAKKKVGIAGRKAESVTLDEVRAATAHFAKFLKYPVGKPGKDPGNNELAYQAMVIQQFAREGRLPELSEDSISEYLEVIYRYYVERANWESVSPAFTKDYAEHAKRIEELTERLEQRTATIHLGVAAWQRRIPDDILISNVCGDCTCTSGTHAEKGTSRLADNGYSILKIYLIEKKPRHIGNIYCMAYTADGRSCLALDGIEVTRSFRYGSREAAGALVGFAKDYAKACRFERVVLNDYPSNISWIARFVKKNYRISHMDLHKIGGNEHITELGLGREKVLAEGRTEVYRLV